MRILIIKCGALGDVVRSTALLRPLTRRYPGAEIWWLSSAAARPLLAGNPLVDFPLSVGPAALARLAGVRFDWVLSMEEDPVCAGLQRVIAHERWTGVTPGAKRLGYTADSAPYYAMSLLHRDPGGGHRSADALKNANRRSFEDIWCAILGLKKAGAVPQIVLSRRDRAQAAAVVRSLGLERLPLSIGINAGAGARWPAKRIPDDAVKRIGARLRARWGVPALLLGGPQEARRNARLAARSRGSLVDMGARHPLRVFAALLERLDALLSTDTLAMHLANALGTPVVAAFGPTSAREISLVDGVCLTPPEPCRCFYRVRCTWPTSCLGSISDDAWLKALTRLLPRRALKQ
ncbi:MAG: glycosyltransferase family 9 protein [Elusimicrobiota bacterium]